MEEISFETDYPNLDRRPIKELREEINYSQLGIMGYSFKEAKRYIKYDEKVFHGN